MQPALYNPSSFEFHEAPTQPELDRRSRATPEAPLVLVVEDNEDTLFIYTESLAHMGYRAAGERDGAHGVEAAFRLRPAAVLMDVAMPGMSGIDATRRIKADPRTQACFVIVVTAYGSAMFDEARAAGSDAYFCKPFNPFALDTVLRAVSISAHLPSPPARFTFLKLCGCGRTFSRLQWLALPLCGRMHVPGSEAVVELRNCTCGSSLAVELENG